MLKIAYPICCGMDVHKAFIVACIASTNEQGVTTYKSKRFSTFTNDLRRCAVWLAETTVRMCAWKPQGSIRFLFTTSWRVPAPSFWPTPSTSRQSEARKQTRKTPNGSLIFSSTVWYPAVLSRLRISGSSGI